MRVAALATVAAGLVFGALLAGPSNAGTSGSCKTGKPAIVASSFVCLKIGVKCEAVHQVAYFKYGFICTARRLVKKPKLTAPKPKPVTTPTATVPTTTVAPTPALGSARTSPLPLGAAAALGNGWTLTVTGATLDATSSVLAANIFNKPPAAGSQDVMVTISATYNGQGSSQFNPGNTLHLVGASNVAYVPYTNPCGVMPAPSLYDSNPQTFTGGTISGNGACFQVLTSDIASLELFAQPLGSQTQTWFALR